MANISQNSPVVIVILPLLVPLLVAVVAAIIQIKSEKDRASNTFIRENRSRLYNNIQRITKYTDENYTLEGINNIRIKLEPLVEELRLYSPPSYLIFNIERHLLILEKLCEPLHNEYSYLLPHSLAESRKDILELMARDMDDLIKKPSMIKRFRRWQDEGWHYFPDPLDWMRRIKWQHPYFFYFLLVYLVLIFVYIFLLFRR